MHPTLLQIEDVDPDIFRQVLKYLYTKTCDLFKVYKIAFYLYFTNVGWGENKSYLILTEK